MTKVFATNIKQIIDDDKLFKFYSMLSANRKRQVNNYKVKEDYLRSILGEGIVRLKVAEYLGVQPEDLNIGRNNDGKPVISNVQGIHFNISHSNDWVACIISEFPCGIDIEKVDKPHFDIARRFFAKNEYEQIVERNVQAKKELFYEFWTLKESYIKFTGQGLSVPLNSFEFRKIGDFYELTSSEGGDIKFRQPEIDGDYKTAICFMDEGYVLEYVLL